MTSMQEDTVVHTMEGSRTEDHSTKGEGNRQHIPQWGFLQISRDVLR